jgi:hypothetical protein
MSFGRREFRLSITNRRWPRRSCRLRGEHRVTVVTRVILAPQSVDAK